MQSTKPKTVMWASSLEKSPTKAKMVVKRDESHQARTEKQVRSYSRSSSSSSLCHHCKRKGHKISECWRKTGSCLICGRNHQIEDCPKFDPEHRSRSKSRNRDKVSDLN